ncbi:MAG: SLATT domain-containing protein [Enterococcus sp.]
MSESNDKLQSYVDTRIHQPISRLNKKIKRYKRVVFFSNFSKLILSSSIPILVPLVPTFPRMLTVIAIISATVSIVQGINSLTDYESKIALMSKFVNDVEKEWILFDTQTDVYATDEESAFHLLIKNVESLYEERIKNLMDVNN